jgi:HSP20 family protein
MNGFFSAAELLQEMDRLQQTLLGSQGTMPTSVRAGRLNSFPSINVGSTEESVEIVAFIPGMQPNEIEVTIDKGLLTISGERKPDDAAAKEENRHYAQERYTGAFRRAVELPRGADPNQVTAQYTNGCLCISVAKHESSKPRTVSVA